MLFPQLTKVSRACMLHITKCLKPTNFRPDVGVQSSKQNLPTYTQIYWMFLVDLVVDRQFDVQLTQAKEERKNEKKLTYVRDRT